jgi:hypothetical protein
MMIRGIPSALEGVNILDPKTTIFIDVVPHGQPWGMVFDPVTNDFLFNAGGTYAADIFLVRGFPPGIDMWLVMTNTRTRYEEISALILVASRRDRLLRRTRTLAKEQDLLLLAVILQKTMVSEQTDKKKAMSST